MGPSIWLKPGQDIRGPVSREESGCPSGAQPGQGIERIEEM